MKLEIYLDDGRVFYYDLPSVNVRKHARTIVRLGYRHSPEGEEYWEWYPAHRIVKVKCNTVSGTKYYDKYEPSGTNTTDAKDTKYPNITGGT